MKIKASAFAAPTQISPFISALACIRDINGSK